MVIYIGSDHRGFQLKEYLKGVVKDAGYTVADLGNDHYDEGDDYPDFAERVARKVSVDYENSRGILLCGSGVGVDVVANKFPNVRSALVANSDQAFDSRNDDDANILSLGANYLDGDAAKKIVITWLETSFAGDPRFKRRLKKIGAVELKLLESFEADQQSLERGNDSPQSW